ncbi:helix-turn-helix domain-containing protein [Chloroflexota bacterium]
MTKITERLTLTVDEAAQALGLSRNSCYQAVETKAIPSIRIGKRILIPRFALEKLLAGSQFTQTE